MMVELNVEEVGEKDMFSSEELGFDIVVEKIWISEELVPEPKAVVTKIFDRSRRETDKYHLKDLVKLLRTYDYKHVKKVTSRHEKVPEIYHDEKLYETGTTFYHEVSEDFGLLLMEIYYDCIEDHTAMYFEMISRFTTPSITLPLDTATDLLEEFGEGSPDNGPTDGHEEQVNTTVKYQDTKP